LIPMPSDYILMSSPILIRYPKRCPVPKSPGGRLIENGLNAKGILLIYIY
jgi:hypothetical protein